MLEYIVSFIQRDMPYSLTVEFSPFAHRANNGSPSLGL
jgi:hypothetical protein